MLANIEDFGRFADLEEFIEVVKDDEDFDVALEVFMSSFRNEYGVQISDITEFLEKLKNGDLVLEDQYRWIADILNSVSNRAFFLEFNEKEFIVKEVFLSRFEPDYFKEEAFLFFTSKGELEVDFDNYITDSQWIKFKRELEKSEFPASLWENIRDFVNDVYKKTVRKNCECCE